MIHHKRRLSQIRDIKSHCVPDRIRRRLGHVTGKLSPRNASKERKTTTRWQSLITCERNPARQSRRMKKRKSRDKSRATATRQPLSRLLHLVPSLCLFYLSWRRCCFCSLWLIASCDVKINGPLCARQTIHISFFFFFFFLVFFFLAKFFCRRGGGGPPEWGKT